MRFFHKHRKKIIAALALLLALLMILPTITMILGSAGAKVTQEEIDRLKEESAALAQEKKELSNQLDALEGEINSAYSKKLVVEQEIMVVEQQIATTEDLIAQYDQLIVQEEENLTQAQADEAKHFEEFCRRVRIMEEQGTATYWQILFNAADFTDLLDRAMMISEVVEYDNAVMKALEQARIAVEEAKAALESARAEQVAAKETLDAQKAELDAKRATIESLLVELEAKQDQYESQMDDLEKAADDMDDEIARMVEELERQRAAEAIQYDTGTGYLWPLKDCFVITSFFGPRKHPITGKPGNHGGTDVRAAYGTSIMAARGGEVIASTYNKSYGNYVIVYHGNNESTLYAHMSRRTVSTGDIVKQGDELGKVGSTGSSNGNHLHFEVRINNVKVDALNYYPNVNFWYKYNGGVYPLED